MQLYWCGSGCYLLFSRSFSQEWDSSNHGPSTWWFVIRLLLILHSIRGRGYIDGENQPQKSQEEKIEHWKRTLHWIRTKTGSKNHMIVLIVNHHRKHAPLYETFWLTNWPIRTVHRKACLWLQWFEIYILRSIWASELRVCRLELVKARVPLFLWNSSLKIDASCYIGCLRLCFHPSFLRLSSILLVLKLFRQFSWGLFLIPSAK